MGIFKRLIREWMHGDEPVKGNATAEVAQNNPGRMTFYVTPAHGGRIVEVFHPYREDQHGRQISRADPRPFLITDEQDFAAELAKIVTLEFLR